eukprot:756222-Hanusia_phi.AAC.7
MPCNALIASPQQVNALEALLLVKRLDVDAELPKKLSRYPTSVPLLCLMPFSLSAFMHDAAQKVRLELFLPSFPPLVPSVFSDRFQLLLKVDEIEGEEPHRQARKVEERADEWHELMRSRQMFVHKMNSVLDRLERLSHR